MLRTITKRSLGSELGKPWPGTQGHAFPHPLGNGDGEGFRLLDFAAAGAPGAGVVNDPAPAVALRGARHAAPLLRSWRCQGQCR